MQRNRVADCGRTDEVGFTLLFTSFEGSGKRKRAAAPRKIAATVTANCRTITQGVPAFRSTESE